VVIASSRLFVQPVTNIQQLTALVIATMGANPVWQHGLVTVAAVDQLWRADRIMGATPIATTLAQFPLW